MSRRKGKSVSFDAMVKFFMHSYNIPTKNDIDRIMARLDELERLVVDMNTPRLNAAAGSSSAKKRGSRSRMAATAADKVFTVIQTFPDGASFADIQRRTGFEDKKLRNIIFRLHKNGRIHRKSRGMYIAA